MGSSTTPRIAVSGVADIVPCVRFSCAVTSACQAAMRTSLASGCPHRPDGCLRGQNHFTTIQAEMQEGFLAHARPPAHLCLGHGYRQAWKIETADLSLVVDGAVGLRRLFRSFPSLCVTRRLIFSWQSAAGEEATLSVSRTARSTESTAAQERLLAPVNRNERSMATPGPTRKSLSARLGCA